MSETQDRRAGPRVPPGVEVLHARACGSREGGRCDCKPSYRAAVYDKRTGKKWRTKSSRSLAGAKGWLVDAKKAAKDGTLPTPSKLTVRQAWEEWLSGARAGTVTNRTLRPYKPSVIRSYETHYRLQIDRRIGAVKVVDIRRRDVQCIIDEMLAAGYSPSSARNAVMPLRVLFAHAIHDEVLTINPTSHLRIPPVTGTRDRVASSAEATKLLAALTEDRALWATAIYAGLRRGELRALRWNDVDLAAGLLGIERAWDDKEGPTISPKSDKGTRKVPIASVLRDYLDALKIETGRSGADLVFGRSPSVPFSPTVVQARADRSWKAAGLQRLTLHEGRHTYVTLMFEAGLSLERIGDYVGHSSTYMTERYRHLLEGHEAETRDAFDAYLARADTADRLRQLEGADHA